MPAEESREGAFDRIKSTHSTPDGRYTLKLTPLGAGQEVGRSCILLEFNEKRVLVSDGAKREFSDGDLTGTDYCRNFISVDIFGLSNNYLFSTRNASSIVAYILLTRG